MVALTALSLIQEGSECPLWCHNSMVLRTAWLNTHPGKRSKQKKWGWTYYYIDNQDTHILVRKLLQNIIYIYLEYLDFYQQGSHVHNRLSGSVSSSAGVGCVTMSTPGMIKVSGLCFGIQLIEKPWFVQAAKVWMRKTWIGFLEGNLSGTNLIFTHWSIYLIYSYFCLYKSQIVMRDCFSRMAYLRLARTNSNHGWLFLLRC